MKKMFVAGSLLLYINIITAQENPEWKNYTAIIKKTIYNDYKGMYKEAGESLAFPFITPGSSQYSDQLWDWDSWLSNIALRQVLLESATDKDRNEAMKYEQGCILNFLSFSGTDGWIPIVVGRKADMLSSKPAEIYTVNMHKPCLAQHAAFLVNRSNGDAKWLSNKFYHLQTFVNNYINHHRHAATGLYYWQNDAAIGVDNDPGTYYRPAKSSGSIYLNSLMYKELKAMVYLCNQLNLSEIAASYETNAKELYSAIQKHCWDEKDGFFYSVDLNLLPVKDERGFVLHSGMPRDWDCLIQRLGVWSGFLPLWAGIATPEQAKRMVNENFKDKRTFNAPFGVRTLSKLEKMYNLKASGNPSSWLGPIWGICNYMVWNGLVKYGFKNEARELASKSIVLFGRDVQKTGTMHEYYQPENGEPILNPGFQNWNYLVLNMIAWMEDREVVETF